MWNHLSDSTLTLLNCPLPTILTRDNFDTKTLPHLTKGFLIFDRGKIEKWVDCHGKRGDLFKICQYKYYGIPAVNTQCLSKAPTIFLGDHGLFKSLFGLCLCKVPKFHTRVPKICQRNPESLTEGHQRHEENDTYCSLWWVREQLHARIHYWSGENCLPACTKEMLSKSLHLAHNWSDTWCRYSNHKAIGW